MSFWRRATDYFARRPYDGADRPPAPPAPPPKKEIVRKAPRSISKAQFEALVASQAQLLAAGGIVTAHHYTLARNEVKRDLDRKGITVMEGDPAAHEAGGVNKV